MSTINAIDELADAIRHPNDKAIGAVSAAYRVFEKFVIIPKSDLPEAKVIERNGATHVDCGSDWGTWRIQEVGRMRTVALDYVAAWVKAEAWHDAEAEKSAERDKRRDELASEFTAVNSYNGQLPYTQKLIDRIIDLEQAAS